MNDQSEKLTYRSEKLKEKLEKLYEKRDKLLQEIETTEAAYKNEQDLEAGSVVRLYKLTPREMAGLLQSLKKELPYSEEITENIDVEEEEFDEEEKTEEEDMD